MIIKPTRNLSGEIKAIPSKSFIHRALISAALAEGVSLIDNVIYSKDIQATLSMIESIGARCILSDNQVSITPKSSSQSKKFHANESGTSLRLMIPIVAALGLEAEFSGNGQLVNRPIDEYLKIFDEQNIPYKYEGKLPLYLKGKLESGYFEVDGSISSQYISGLLMALPLLNGDSRIKIVNEFTSKAYVDITIQVLSEFGINIERMGLDEYHIKGNQTYKSNNVLIENDYSQAAFWIVGASINGDVVIRDLNEKSIQGDMEIIEIVNQMGGKVYFDNGELIIKKAMTHGIEIDAEQIPDLVPILTLLATASRGRTRIYNTRRLSAKESDRGRVITEELNKLGAKIQYFDNELIIDGVDLLSNGKVSSYNDHRIAMTLALASLKSNGNIEIEGMNAIKKSYPKFIEDFVTSRGSSSIEYSPLSSSSKVKFFLVCSMSSFICS